MSRFHCLLEVMPPDRCRIEDLNSMNGTYVGARKKGEVSFQRLAEGMIRSGDLVKVGKTVFHLEWIEETKTREKEQIEEDLEEQLIVRKDFPPGTNIGPFELIRLLGKGGIAEVYLVKHTHKPEQSLALKIIQPRVNPTRSQQHRFVREATYGAQIKHENIVRHYSPGHTTSGVFYIPMEYVPGVDMKKYLQKLQRPMTFDESRGLIAQFLDAIAYLHKNNIVHRDIKPSNLLVFHKNGDLAVKLADFGLAKNYQEAGWSGITMSYRLLGTPEFMAPEQCYNARDVDARADIYSAAATIYNILSGKKIHQYKNIPQLLNKILTEEVVPLGEIQPDLPPVIAQAITRCLDKDPKERLQTVEELQQLFL